MKKLPEQPKELREGIKMNELARLSGVSKSTIHHYVKMGLLHPPQKVGFSLSVYDWTHLSRLKRIRDLRKNQNLSLSKIRQILAEDRSQFLSISQQHEESMSLIKTLDEQRRQSRTQKSEKKRIEIIDAAIALFSKYGYEKTTIDAIADSLQIAKSTVYLYFESKEDLFMECIGRLTLVAVPEQAWEEIRREKNALERIKKRGLAFHKAFPSYKGILTLTKAALGGENRKLHEKAKNTLSLMTYPMAKDLRRGMADGTLRKIDEELVAHFILGMGDGLGCRLMMDSRYSIEQGMEAMMDVLSRGIEKRDTAITLEHETPLCSGKIIDIKGTVTQVTKIKFNNRSRLPVKMGKAEVRIDPSRLRSIRFQQKGSSFWAELEDNKGQTSLAEIDGSLLLSGKVSLGEFVIELKNVDRVLFYPSNAQGSHADDSGDNKE